MILHQRPATEMRAHAADRVIIRASSRQGAPAGMTLSAALGICPPQPLSDFITSRNVTASPGAGAPDPPICAPVPIGWLIAEGAPERSFGASAHADIS
jgi:hypothetical protein